MSINVRVMQCLRAILLSLPASFAKATPSMWMPCDACSMMITSSSETSCESFLARLNLAMRIRRSKKSTERGFWRRPKNSPNSVTVPLPCPRSMEAKTTSGSILRYLKCSATTMARWRSSLVCNSGSLQEASPISAPNATIAPIFLRLVASSSRAVLR